MFDFSRFSPGVRWFFVSCISAQMAVLGITLMLSPKDVVEQPGQISKDASKLGGPCLAIKQFEYAKHGPQGIGDCQVQYTKRDQTAAKVTLEIFRRNSWTIVTADVVTDGGPLASLNWRVIPGTETSLDDPQS